MRETNLELQKRYNKLWHQFVAGEIITDFPNQLILDSWQRCRSMNVDPAQKIAREVLSKESLNSLRERNSLFLEVSMPILENIYGFVAGSGFTVALSDSDGYLMEVFGDDNIRDSAQRGRWMPGASWSELSAGTNVVGTPLYLDQPISLAGYEHYCRCSHKWVGAGAPIHNSDGKIFGVVALAGIIEEAHAHTLGMVIAAANAIEIQLAMKKAWDEAELANQHKNVIVNSILDGLLVTDGDGKITLINQRAQEILRSPGNKLLGVHIKDLFSETLMSYLGKKQSQVINIQDDITINNEKIKCTVTCRHIMTNRNYNRLVIVINEIARVKKLVDKMITHNARHTFADIIGNDYRFCETLGLAKTVAPKECNVLLLGESGTGKDMFAHAIHNASTRRLGPFVAINCGAIPKELIGSELFGYSGGAFTGASKGGKMGKFELAEGGTLFLDEIGEMPAEQQRTLLRVLEDRNISRLGSQRLIPVDVRIIAATNKDLGNEVRNGTFRQDLFYRLNVFSITMIPLRERKSDIKPLVKAFLSESCQKMGGNLINIPEDVWELLHNYDWPGNIRELNNVLERALILSDGKNISCQLFNLPSKSNLSIQEHPSNPIRRNLQQYEADLLKNLLKRNEWNISKASLELGVSRTTVYRKMGLHGIKVPAQYRHI